MQEKKTKRAALDVRAAIREAVAAGLQAGAVHAERATNDAYKSTERRLYAYPVLARKIADDRERLKEMKAGGAPGKSQSIVRFSRSGLRLSPEEMLEALAQDLRATIGVDEYEVQTIDTALATIADDPYYQAVAGKYIGGQGDDEIAAGIPCDTSTVRRNRGRLVRVLAVRLYGAAAV